MISSSSKKFCNEPLSCIENYEEAIHSNNNYDLHHRLETSEGLSRQYLIDHGLYYNRPAEELIFLECSIHHYLHQLCKTHTEEEAYEIIALNKKLDPETAYNLHHENKIPVHDIAKSYGTTDKTVYRRIHKYLRNEHLRSVHIKSLEELTPELVYRLHKEDRKPIYKIAEEYNTTSKTVQKRLEKFYKENNINNSDESNIFDFDPLSLTSPEELFDWYIIQKYDLNRISYLLNLDEVNIKKLLHLWNIDDRMNWSNPHRWKVPEVHYTVSNSPIQIDRPDFSWMKI